MKSFIPLLLVAVVLGASCRSQSPSAPVSISAANSRAPSTSAASGSATTAAPAIVEQWSGAYGEVTTAGTRSIMTAEAWKELWRNVQREAPRPLDPSREMAVAVFMGERRTGGYAIEVVSVRAAEGRLVVDYRESAPSPEMMVTQAITAPWAIALIGRTELPVTFQKLSASARRREQ